MPPPFPPAPWRDSFSPRSPLPRPPEFEGRAGPCSGIARSDGIGSRSSASRTKARSETTSSCTWTGRPATSSRAARSARRTCSSVPSRMMSDRAASTASRIRRRRSDPQYSLGEIQRRWGLALGGGLAAAAQVAQMRRIDGEIAGERATQGFVSRDQCSQPLVDLAVHAFAALLNREHGQQADADANKREQREANQCCEQTLPRREIKIVQGEPPCRRQLSGFSRDR